MRRAAQWESETSSLTARLESARARRQQYEQKQEDVTTACATLDAERAALGTQVTSLSTAIDEQSRAAATAHERSAQLVARQRQISEQLAQSRERLTAARERAAVLEEFQRRREGYNEAVKEVLALADETSGPYQHVRGVVAELLQVNLEMAPLIEVALGERASTSS